MFASKQAVGILNSLLTEWWLGLSVMSHYIITLVIIVQFIAIYWGH